MDQNTFMDRYLRGEVDGSQIDDAIDEWHEKKPPETLVAFLGMTEAEYRQWVLTQRPCRKLRSFGV